MVKSIKMAFEHETLMISIDDILPLKQILPSVKKQKKYRQIVTSTKEVGIVEPLVVYPQNGKEGGYLLLDGHLRLDVLKDLGQKEVLCLISKDDERFSYGVHVNYLSTIQEHFMLLRAIKNGLPEERIATTINVDTAKIRQKQNLLDGICTEAVDLLKDKNITANAIRVFRKVKPIRQIELAELMIAANNYTVPYSKALLAATPKKQLNENEKEKKVAGLSQEEIVRMEKEMESLEREFKVIEESYGPDILNLVVARRYLSNLLDNGHIAQFLLRNYPEMLTEIQKIVEAVSLEN